MQGVTELRGVHLHMILSNFRPLMTRNALPTLNVTLATVLLLLLLLLLGATSLRASPTAACAKPTASAECHASRVTRHASLHLH
jgi:hypothetical protein